MSPDFNDQFLSKNPKDFPNFENLNKVHLTAYSSPNRKPEPSHQKAKYLNKKAMTGAFQVEVTL